MGHACPEDHAWECRLSLQGKRDSVKDFKQVRDTTSGGSVEDRLASEQDWKRRNQLGRCRSGPGGR